MRSFTVEDPSDEVNALMVRLQDVADELADAVEAESGEELKQVSVRLWPRPLVVFGAEDKEASASVDGDVHLSQDERALMVGVRVPGNGRGLAALDD